MINSSELDSLQVIQNKALRCITKSHIYTKISSMLEVTQLFSVKQSIVFNVLIFIFKLQNGLLPSYLQKNYKMVSEVHNYNTRARNNFHVKRTKTIRTRKQLFINGLELYNGLPANIKNAKNLKQFKKICIDFVKKTWPI